MTVLITGATSGVGLELARRYQPWARLILLGRKPLSTLKDPLFTQQSYIQCDLSQPECGARVLKALDERGVTHLNHLILNAGLGYYGELHQQPLESIDELLKVNLYAPLRLTHRLLPKLKPGGRLAFVSSVAADLPAANYAVYAATKAGLSGFARNLRLERPDLNIYNLYPGAVKTELHAKSGVPASELRDELMLSASEVAEDIAEALKRPGREVTLGLVNRLGRQAGRRLGFAVDPLIARLSSPQLKLPPTLGPRRALVTGAASGIGKALTERLLAENYHVFALDRDTFPEQLKGPNLEVIQEDLRDPDLLTQVSKRLADAKLQLLIHSAGISHVGPFTDSDLAAQLDVLDVNLRAPFQLTRSLLADSHLARGGTAVFISSLSHYLGYPGASVYGASKDGLTSYARSLRAALWPELEVLTVFPGPTRTPHAERYSPDNSRSERRMPPALLAERIVKAAQSGQSRLVPSAGLQLAALLGRWLPSLTDSMMLRTLYEPLQEQAARQTERDLPKTSAG